MLKATISERITALGTKVVLPTELLQGLDDLRLLGNDAAHIENRDYDQVGNGPRGCRGETTLTCALGKWSEGRGNQCVRFASDADWVV